MTPIDDSDRPRLVRAPQGQLDIVTVDRTAADARNVAELQRRLRAAGGALVVSPDSSDYIVAANNGLRFTVTATGDGRYRLTESSGYQLVIGAAILAAVFLILNRR